ncbi:molecular chaperone TorD family protein [Halopiger aswanensis]|uniref:TorA maturation chaperone TorD n=1 Tax=Halopiger aswanensis TaxID=148449 RepID=A0A419W0P8_9EURY|nr:molecular chaperone TorD family protein [Halopiger aswanensis]RKD89046.1 TorA maturation chaperone TorD [Halopiger aswanensis]
MTPTDSNSERTGDAEAAAPCGVDPDSESASDSGPALEPGGIADARATLYELLAAAFDGEVDVLATAIEDGALVDVAATLPIGSEPDALGRTAVDADALSIAYDNLFVVPGPRYVPPIASAHRDRPSESFESDSPFHDEGAAGELLGDPAAAMASLYDRAGFRPERGDFPDHVAAQLEFLAATTRAAALRRDRGDEDAAERFERLQDETLTQLGWLDSFHEAVADADGDGVFAATAALARTAAAWHARDLDGDGTDAETG